MFAILNYYGFEMEKASSTAWTFRGNLNMVTVQRLDPNEGESAPFKYTKQREETH